MLHVSPAPISLVYTFLPFLVSFGGDLVSWLPCPRSSRLYGFSTAVLYIMYHTVEGWGALFFLYRIFLVKHTTVWVYITHQTPVKIHLFKLFFLPRMEELRERKMMTAKSPKDARDPSLFSSRHLNPVYSSPLLSTPPSHPTRATCDPPFASPTTPSPCPPTRLRQSSAPFAKALASTSPRSCPLLQPAARACPLLQPPSQQHAACCAPVS